MAHGLPRVSKRRKKVEKEKQKMYDSPSEERMCMCVCVCVCARACVYGQRESYWTGLANRLSR